MMKNQGRCLRKVSPATDGGVGGGGAERRACVKVLLRHSMGGMVELKLKVRLAREIGNKIPICDHLHNRKKVRQSM